MSHMGKEPLRVGVCTVRERGRAGDRSTLNSHPHVRICCSLSAGGDAGTCVAAAPCEDESATSPAPSRGGPSHDSASLCATKSLGSPTVSRRDAPAVSRGRPRWTSTAASRQPALHMPKVAACETCQRPVSVLAATMPARRAKHVTTPMPEARTAVGSSSAAYTHSDWLKPSAAARERQSSPSPSPPGSGGSNSSMSTWLMGLSGCGHVGGARKRWGGC
eukprot:scaffold24884_cov67-Phaeocystis_antarctica.AAC.6